MPYTLELNFCNQGKDYYARVSGVLDAMLIDSDDLDLVPPEGRALFAEAVSLQGGRVAVDGVLEDDLYVIRSEGGPAGKIRLAANLSDSERRVEEKMIPARSAVFLEGPAVARRNSPI